MNFKRFVATSIFIFSFVTFSCSDNDNPVVYDPDALRVAGKYEAVTYSTPGSYDISVDVLALGGHIKMELFLDFSAKGEIFIPKTAEINGSGDKTEFEGSYKIKNDSLQFIGMNNILSHPNIYFIIKGDSLNAYFGGNPFPPVIIELLKN